MPKGLMLKRDAFDSLPQKEKLGVLFDHQVYQGDLMQGYKFYQKVSATVGTFLLAAVGFLAKLVMGGSK